MFGFFERLVDPFANGFSPVQPNTVRRFIIKEIYGLKKFMLLVAIGSMCIAATEVYIFKYLGGLVDAMENTDQFFSNNIGTLIQICFVLLVGLPLVILFHTLFWQQALEGNFPLRVLSSAHQYLLKHRIQFYQVEAAGKVANTLLQTTASIRHVVLKLIDTFMYAFVFFVSMGLMLSSLNLYLLAPIGLWLIGYVFVISYFVPKLKFWSNKQASARSEMVGQLVDTYSNIVTVKLFSHSSIEKNYAQQYMSKYLRTVYGQARFISTVLFLMWLLNIMLIFGTTAMSLYLWSKGTISIGAIAAAIGVVFRVYTMSHWIMWEVSGLFGHLGVIQDGIKLLFKPLHESIGQKRPPLDVAQFNISFKDVAFSYMGESNVIDGLSIDIKSGEKIGIIGKSGSGKSTVIKLLLGFYDADSGQIEIGGKNIKSIDPESLLEKIAVVAQDVELLDRSIRENLTYGKECVSEAEMIHAAKLSGAHKFILELTDECGRIGYDAHIGVRGSRLSGGQRQRISLARALIKDAPILILDEATSALDSEIESHILNNLKEYLKNKTTIMIAHRLSTLAHMDKLVILDKGKVLECGTHDQLLAKKGKYFNMVASQSDGALNEEALLA